MHAADAVFGVSALFPLALRARLSMTKLPTRRTNQTDVPPSVVAHGDSAASARPKFQ